MRVTFGPWTPDLPDLDASGLEECVNCVPRDNGYGPFRAGATLGVGGASFSSTLAAATTLPNDKAGGYETLAGTINNGANPPKLYRMTDLTTGWVNVSRTVTYSTSLTRWQFTMFGATEVAVNGYDTMQVAAPPGNFRDQSASASAPVADVICTVRDFVFANDTSAPTTLAWCQQNNPLRWTPSPRLQSDRQILPGSGYIHQMTGGEFGSIFTAGSVWRISYVGSPIIFRCDEVVPGLGMKPDARDTAARHQNMTFFYSLKGFHVFDGQQAFPIGAGKVDDWFNDNAQVQANGLARMSSVIDPINSLYILSYPSVGNVAPDRLLMYHWPSQRWARASYTTERIFGHLTFLPGTGTARSTGVLAVMGINPSGHSLEELTGATKVATIITGEAQLVQDRHAFVRSIRPLIHGTAAVTATAQLGRRSRQDDSISYTSAVSMNANGLCPIRSDARYQRGRLDISTSFTHAIGFEIDFKEAGKR